MSKIREELTNFYRYNGIHPENFNCPNRDYCRKFSDNGIMTEAKMSLVGSRYGEKYPKVVVLSLDPPSGEKEDFAEPNQRTTEYVTTLTEGKNYTECHPNPHWAMTQIIVKDILCLFDYESKPNAAVVQESYAQRPIENITSYFAHVNAAKCSMNKQDRKQADPRVHEKCSCAYLHQELCVLEPQILISQGKSANKILSNLFGCFCVENKVPSAVDVQIGAASTLWLPMVHPSRNISTIRSQWSFYVDEIKKWAIKNVS